MAVTESVPNEAERLDSPGVWEEPLQTADTWTRSVTESNNMGSSHNFKLKSSLIPIQTQFVPSDGKKNIFLFI